MTGVEERLREALSIMAGCETQETWDEDIEKLQRELSARGLAVVDVQTIRDLLHLLDTANGLWVTDKPYIGGTASEGPCTVTFKGMYAAPDTYWRQSFTDTDAVKRAREIVDGADKSANLT